MDAEIISEELFVKQCADNNIEIFPSLVGLNLDRDILLIDCEIDSLIRFCNINNLKSIFYVYEFPDVEAYTIDFEKLKLNLMKHFNQNFHISHTLNTCKYIKADYFRPLLDKILYQAEQRVTLQNSLVKDINPEEPDFFEAYTCYNGFKVGYFISLNPVNSKNDTDKNDLYTTATIFKELANLLDKQIESKVAEAIKEDEKISKAEEERRNQILSKIEQLLNIDERLIKLKYKNARQTYAEMLRKDWENKYNIVFKKSEIQEVVERVYLLRTSK